MIYQLETQVELEDSLKVLVKRNNELIVLLEKANIKAPYFVEPKNLSFIVTVHEADATSNEANAEPSINANILNKSVECDSQLIGKNGVDNIESPPSTNNADASDKFSPESQASTGKNQPRSIHTLPDEGESKKFGSVEVIAVTNTTQLDSKPHQQPVKNSVEITPLITNIQSTELLAEPHSELHAPTAPASITPISNSTGSSTATNDVKHIDQDCATLLDQSSNSKMVADIDSSNGPTDSPKTDNIPTPVSNIAYKIVKPCQAEPAIYKSNDSSITENAAIASKTIEKPAEATQCTPKLSVGQVSATKSSIIKELQVNTNNIVNRDTIASEKDLDDELFESFRLPQTPSESNPNAMSPTAAFLLSFPVVSTATCSKQTETDNTSNLLRLDDKANQAKDHNILESISSFDFAFNDLNDVSNDKNISNHEINDDGQFPYAIGKTRSTESTDDSIKSKRRSTEMFGKHDSYIPSNNENNKNEKNIQILNDTKLPSAELSKPYSSDYLPASTSHDYSYSKPYNNTPTKTTEVTSVAPPPENFYSSLSSLGLPMKQTVPATSAVPQTTAQFNFQISSLTQSHTNIAESRAPLLADPPQFTFSLSKPTDSIYVSKAQPSSDTTTHPSVNRVASKKTKKSTPTKHSVSDRLANSSEPTVPSLSRCTAYNPFAFDNPISTSSSLTLSNLMTTPSSTITAMNTSFSFSLAPPFTTMPTTTPMLSNTEPLFSSSFEMPLLGPNSSTTKPVNKKQKSVPQANIGQTDGHAAKDSTPKTVRISSVAATTAKPIRNHVNWMTSTVAKSSHELDLSSNLFSGSTEEATTWSANRLIDSNSLNSCSTLPQLQGDLSLNTMSTNFGVGGSSSGNNHNYRNDIDTDNKKHLPAKTFSPQKFGSSKSASNRKADTIHPKYGKAERSMNSFHNFPATVSNASTLRNSDGQTVNNFHSVSQLVDTQERQVNKPDIFFPLNDDKMHHPREVNHSMKQKLPDKLTTMNSYNVGLNDYLSNDFDKDLSVPNYLFNTSKRLKLNYGNDSYLSSNQNTNSYDTANTNDIHSSYANYQSYELDCSSSTAPCINNLANQTFPYQYSQSQPYHQQQQFHAPQNTCDTVEPLLSQSYFQASAPLPAYKSASLNDFPRSNMAKVATNQPLYTAMNVSTKSHHINGEPKASSSINPSHSTNHSIQSINKISNRMASTSKASTHYTASVAPSTSQQPQPPPLSPPPAPPANNLNNINNITLNQPWNDSFSWMPYSNHTYNSQLFSNEASAVKTNSSTNTNTIPNFNLTTIFPDCNKS